jgi:hypothetical protein
MRVRHSRLKSRILSKFAGPAMFSAVNLLKTPVFLEYLSRSKSCFNSVNIVECCLNLFDLIGHSLNSGDLGDL